MFVIVSLGEAAKNSRPIVIKEAKALREYYEDKFKDMKEKTTKAKEDRDKYNALYESELRRNWVMNDIRGENSDLKKRVERLSNELNSSDDRINEMSLENARLKEQIKALKKPASKKPAKKGK
jgi:uncharacterized coiled-coil DUF342 family protein